MRGRLGLIVLLAAAAVGDAPTGAADHGCWTSSPEAEVWVPVGSEPEGDVYYVDVSHDPAYVAVWQETNRIPGLQRMDVIDCAPDTFMAGQAPGGGTNDACDDGDLGSITYGATECWFKCEPGVGPVALGSVGVMTMGGYAGVRGDVNCNEQDVTWCAGVAACTSSNRHPWGTAVDGECSATGVNPVPPQTPPYLSYIFVFCWNGRAEEEMATASTWRFPLEDSALPATLPVGATYCFGHACFPALSHSAYGYADPTIQFAYECGRIACAARPFDCASTSGGTRCTVNGRPG